jgi:hypothetical protein
VVAATRAFRMMTLAVKSAERERLVVGQFQRETVENQTDPLPNGSFTRLSPEVVLYFRHDVPFSL